MKFCIRSENTYVQPEKFTQGLCSLNLPLSVTTQVFFYHNFRIVEIPASSVFSASPSSGHFCKLCYITCTSRCPHVHHTLMSNKKLEPPTEEFSFKSTAKSSFPPSHFWPAINNSSKSDNFTSYNPKENLIMCKFAAVSNPNNAAASGRCQFNTLQIPPGHVTGSSIQALLNNCWSLSFSWRFTSSLERNNKKTSLDQKRLWIQHCFTANKPGHLPLEKEWHAPGWANSGVNTPWSKMVTMRKLRMCVRKPNKDRAVTDKADNCYRDFPVKGPREKRNTAPHNIMCSQPRSLQESY